MIEICKHYIIKGKVQGVWYRANTQQQAKRLGITGYAKNLDDGSVQVVACGEQSQVEALEKWLWNGSPTAKVDEVNAEEIVFQEFTDFSIG